MVEHFVVGNFLSAVRGHATHGTCHAGRDAAWDFIVRLIVVDGLYQIIPFIVVWVFLTGRTLGSPNQVFANLVLAGEDG